MLVPGCGGISKARRDTAERLAGRGYYVVFVDYISARGLQTACQGGATLDDVANDIGIVSAHLRGLPHVDPSAIGAIGWSWGGAGILTSLASADGDKEPRFRVGATFYPVCGTLAAWRVKTPILMLLGELDDIAPPTPCQDVTKAIGLPTSAPSRAFRGRTIGYHADAARQAWAEVDEFLDRHLKKTR
jgi:dienelactone hydrolase